MNRLDRLFEKYELLLSVQFEQMSLMTYMHGFDFDIESQTRELCDLLKQLA